MAIWFFQANPSSDQTLCPWLLASPTACLKPSANLSAPPAGTYKVVLLSMPCIRPPPHAPCLPLGSSSQGPQMPGALSDVPTFPDLVSYRGQAQLTSHPAVLGPLSLSLTLSLPPGARSSFPPSGFNSSATSSERRTWHGSRRPRQSDCSLFTYLEHLTTGRAYLSAAYAVSSVRMQSRWGLCFVPARSMADAVWGTGGALRSTSGRKEGRRGACGVCVPLWRTLSSSPCPEDWLLPAGASDTPRQEASLTATTAGLLSSCTEGAWCLSPAPQLTLAVPQQVTRGLSPREGLACLDPAGLGSAPAIAFQP